MRDDYNNSNGNNNNKTNSATSKSKCTPSHKHDEQNQYFPPIIPKPSPDKNLPKNQSLLPCTIHHTNHSHSKRHIL